MLILKDMDKITGQAKQHQEARDLLTEEWEEQAAGLQDRLTDQ
jgi:hypothetical protein